MFDFSNCFFFKLLDFILTKYTCDNFIIEFQNNVQNLNFAKHSFSIFFLFILKY
jgi:hypothetical protein